MAQTKNTRKRRADSDESAPRTAKSRSDGSTQSNRSSSNRSRNESNESSYFSTAADSVRTVAANVPWARVATIALGVAAAAVAVRVIGPRRIVRGVSSLGIAHFAEKNADKIGLLAKDVVRRWWPRVTSATATVVQKPAALLGRF